MIVSTVGSYQVWVYFINTSWRISLTSVKCGSFGYAMNSTFRCFPCQKWSFFQHQSKSMSAWRRNLNCTTDSQSLVPSQMFLPKKTPLHVPSFPNSGNSSTSEVALPPNLTKASSNGLDVLGPCMDLSVHVPNGYLTVIFNWLLSWKQIVRFPMDPSTAYVLES